MADGTAGGGGGGAADLYWIFPNTISTDQANGLWTFRANAGKAFVGFDIEMNVAPTGQSIIIDWEVNGIVIPAYRLTLAIASRYATVAAAVSLAIGDTLKPQVVQVGTTQPGQTATIRARAS
jgi:hypothetical protein